MANPYPADVADSGGNVRLSGAITFTDANNQPGGSAAPITREELDGPGLVIADAASERLGWADGGSPNSLLDLAVPTIPTVITTGVYCFAVSVIAATGLGVDGFFTMQLQLDKDGFNASQYTDSRLATAANAVPFACLTFSWYMPAGARVEVWVTNNDGGGLARSFAITTAHVQRLS